MKVLLERGVWLADGEGDPPRTLIEESAKEFPDVAQASNALAEARRYRRFPNAEIYEDFL